MNVVWGLLSCCGVLVAAVALFIAFFVVKDRIDEKLRWRRWRRAGPIELRNERPPPLPEELLNGRAERQWHGGYLEGGGDALRQKALRLLRHGVVRQAKIIESHHKGDADDWDGYIVYAFERLDGTVEVTRTSSSVNTWGAAMSRGRSSLEPAFDIIDEVTPIGWMHLLLDPQTGEHLIYESLLVETPARARARREAAMAQARAAAAPRPPPPPVWTSLTAQPPTPAAVDDRRILTEVLSSFPSLATDEDDMSRRLVADLLSERGSSRGELIALQITPERTPAQQARIAELLRVNAAAWLPPGVHPNRYEFRRGFAWSVQLFSGTDLMHPEWQFIRQVAWSAQGGTHVPPGFEHLPLWSLTGVSEEILQRLLSGRMPQTVQYLELTLPPNLHLFADRFRALRPIPTIGLRHRRAELDEHLLTHLLDSLPSPSRLRLFNYWGNVSALHTEVMRRPWLQTLELVSMESTAGMLSLELDRSVVRLVSRGRVDTASWDGLKNALRAQGITSLPLYVTETGQTSVQRF